MKFEEIEAIRNRLGLTTRAFADLIGIKLSTYYSYKNSRKPSGSCLILLKLFKNEPFEVLQKMKKV